MISIVVLTMNQPTLLPALEAAVAGAQVVVVDQASAPETAALLDAMVARLGNGSLVIHNEVNSCFAAGCNTGLAAATGDITVFLNDDVVGTGTPPSSWLDRVAVDVKPGGLYGPSVLGFDVDGMSYPYVEGYCLAGYTDLFRRIGGWDAVNFPRAYVEDVELSYRARKHGAELYQTRWNIRHIGNATNATLPGGYDAADGQRERFREMVRADRRAGA